MYYGIRMGSPRVSDIVSICDSLWPPAYAEPWDSVGLVVGDPAAEVSHIHLALDPMDAVIEEAKGLGADFLFTHHPLLLRGITTVAADTLKGGAITELIRAGIAQYNAHTNADSVIGGVSDVLAEAIGLTELTPLVQHSDAPAGVGLGRVGTLPSRMSVRDLATHLAQATPATATGVRIAGDPEVEVERVAVLGGAGDSLFDEVRATGAEVYITSDLRHHPATEARDTAHRRSAGTPHLIDISHWAAESMWMTRAAAQLRERLTDGGMDVTVTVLEISTDPWTERIGQAGG